MDEHYRCLEKMYLAAPINDLLPPTIRVHKGEAEIELEVLETYFHGAGAVHGSIIFKLLDDAAFFASASLEPDVFVLTTSFTIYLTRPVSSGRIRSVGRVVHRNRTQFIAEAVAYNSQGKEIGRGSGTFFRSQRLLKDLPGYSAAG